MSMSSKKLKFIIKLKLNSNSVSLNTKMSTVLAQRRINSSEFFEYFKHKLHDLNINSNNSVMLKVFLIVFDLDDYIVYIKMPSLSSLINKTFFLSKNFKNPGFCFNFTKKKMFHYTITPYMLYEIVKYKYSYENLQSISLLSYYKKSVNSLRSKGINLYIC